MGFDGLYLAFSWPCHETVIDDHDKIPSKCLGAVLGMATRTVMGTAWRCHDTAVGLSWGLMGLI